MHQLAERLLKTIRKQELIKPGDRVAAAVSGGADSVALLLLLLELRAALGIVLSVAHVNHKLRGEESDEDERFVAELARRHDLELHTREAPLDRGRASGIEAAARKLRYDFFRQLARENRAAKIATAHTLDDQAETVLLRILRGTGIRGLSGIHPRLILTEAVEDAQRGRTLGEVVRPLLSFRRAELQEFLRDRAHTWREDSSNRDLSFLRNRVRHNLLPVLQRDFGTAVVENLADLAEIARAEEEQWERVQYDVHTFGIDSAGGRSSSLPLEPGLLSFPLAARRRVVRAWLESSAAVPASFRLVEEVLDLARGPAGKKLELPSGHILRRTQQGFRLEGANDQPESAGYEYALSVPGQIEIRALGISIEAVLVDPEDVPEAERGNLCDSGRVPRPLVLRNWRPGDRFRPTHTKGPRKVKELLSDRHITGIAKKLWPVIVGETGLIWMRGFPVPAELQPPPGAKQALWIRETPAKS